MIQKKLSKFAFKIKLLSSVTLIKCYTMYIYMCVYNCFIYQLLEFHSSFGSKLIIIIVFDSMESGLLICQINLTKQFMKIGKLCNCLESDKRIIKSHLVMCLAELCYIILHLYGGLVDFTNNKRITPLHLLANKPTAFKSGADLRWYEEIIYHCEYTVNFLRLIESLFVFLFICSYSIPLLISDYKSV